MSNYHSNNISILADENLHEKVFEQFLKFSPPKNVRIGILASGNGALDQRLIDHGFTNIKSWDLVNQNLSEVNEFELRDLNMDFEDFGIFYYVFAIEIIEHINNTHHFLASIKKLLNPNGKAIISTPHLEQIGSRFYSLLKNDIPMFNQGMLEKSGHINPNFHHIFLFHLKKLNLTLVERNFNRENHSQNDYKLSSWKKKIFLKLIKKN